jgi:hypothetical protein
MTNLSPTDLQIKSTVSTSRRNFIKGAQLALGAGAALGVSVALGKAALALDRLHLPGQPSSPGAEPCFLTGTRIQTASGPVAVEDLRIGDAVLTASGESKPIKWIGKREASSEAPVKIAKFAIDGCAPLCDLYITQRHAVYIDGFLVPAINLVNGISIVANAKPELSTFTYYHIEFETHEVIQAEGLAVESYRPQHGVDFDNADEYFALYGPRAHAMVPFAPVLSYDSIKHELASRVRSSLVVLYDMRKPLDRIRDRIADQAELAQAA